MIALKKLKNDYFFLDFLIDDRFVYNFLPDKSGWMTKKDPFFDFR
jgi:hypothetical protein